MEIIILRLGHRLPRDERMTTHIALVARAFGAKKAVYSGQHDAGLESSVSRLVGQWGGDFSISHEKNFRRFLKEMKSTGFVLVHLTMYGLPLSNRLSDIKKNEKIVVIVGSEQVPAEIYQLADHNISVTCQPHSEVAALAVLLDRLQDGKELFQEFSDNFHGKVRIVPCERGKNVQKTDQK